MAFKAAVYQAQGNLQEAAKLLSERNAHHPSEIACASASVTVLRQLRLERTLTKSAHAKIIAASISFPMCCHSVGFYMASRMRPAMQSATRTFAADHIMLRFAFTMQPGNVIETHEHAGEFKE